MPRPCRFRRRRATLLSLAAAAVVGCSPREPAVIGPVGDPESAALQLRERTGLEAPLRIVFGWELNDGGQRVAGRGVARVEPPYRARLDLFLDNGETVIRAALVDSDLRLPPGSPDDILPPPDLMWGALGIFRPVGDARLVGADRLEGEAVRLRYQHADGSEVHYRVVDGALRRLELVEGGRVVQWVDVAPERVERYPVEATYRNLTAFRELKLVRESLSAVDAFDPEIWDPAQ
ncbi:MAG: hypothetical protein AB7T31_09835 [Gemmatimonadales bacterium]